MNAQNSTRLTSEMFIPSLNERILELILRSRVSLPESGDKTKILNDLKGILRRTWIMEQFLHHNVISVTGLQGEGKSTLIEELFNGRIEGYMPENLGRGEVIPILISCSKSANTTAKVAHITESESGWKVAQTTISDKKEFQDRSKDPQENDVMLILEVEPPPIPNFPLNISFLVLPGLENQENAKTAKAKMWQALTRDVLFTSMGCIMVVSPTSYAKEECQTLIKQVLKDFNEARPIFVVSKEDRDPDLARSTRDLLAKHFKAETEHDRLILKGSDPKNPGFGRQWGPALLNALANYGQARPAFRQNQIQRLNTTLKEIDQVLQTIKKERAKIQIEETMEYFRIKGLMEYFDKGVRETKVIYKEAVTSALSQRAYRAGEQLNELSDDKDWFSAFLDWFTGGKSLREMEKTIISCWTEGEDIATAMREERILVLNTVARRQLFMHAALDIPTIERPAHGNELMEKSGRTFDPPEEKGELVPICRRETRLDLVYLMHPDKMDYSNNLATSLQLVPCIGLEMSRLFALLPPLQEGLMKGQTTTGIDALKNIGQNVEFFRSFQGKTLTSIAALLGLDAAVDGEVNAIPHLVKAILPTAPAWVASAATGIGLIVTGGFVVASVAHEVAREKTDQLLLGRRLVAAFQDAFYVQYMDHFDRGMNYLRNCIENRLAEKMKLTVDVARLYRLDVAIQSLKESISQIREEMKLGPHIWAD